jgi:hypothetical protein
MIPEEFHQILYTMLINPLRRSRSFVTHTHTHMLSHTTDGRSLPILCSLFFVWKLKSDRMADEDLAPTNGQHADDMILGEGLHQQRLAAPNALLFISLVTFFSAFK